MDVIDAFAAELERLVAGRSKLETAELFEQAKSHNARLEVRDAVRDDRFGTSWFSLPSRTVVETAAGLLGIDDAAEAINPYLGVSKGNRPQSGLLARMHWHYWREHRLSTNKDLVVLPRPRLYQEPSLGPAEHFGSLLPVPREHSQGVRLVGWRGPARLQGWPGAPIGIATLPLLHRDQLELERRDSGGKTWYSIVPDGRTLADQTRNALMELDDSGAQIGLVPEATLDNRILRAWRASMLSTEPSGSLRFVLVGTGAVDTVGEQQPPNRAVMLDRLNGKRVFDQDKLHGYSMTFEDLDSWGAGPAFESARSTLCHEWMREGSALTILEHPPIRLAVLICEDLRKLHLRATMAAWGVTHLLVPVLAPPLQATVGDFGWQANASRDCARDVGCHTIVANSRAHPQFGQVDGELPISSFAYSPAPTKAVYSRPGLPSLYRARHGLDVHPFQLS